MTTKGSIPSGIVDPSGLRGSDPTSIIEGETWSLCISGTSTRLCGSGGREDILNISDGIAYSLCGSRGGSKFLPKTVDLAFPAKRC